MKKNIYIVQALITVCAVSGLQGMESLNRYNPFAKKPTTFMAKTQQELRDARRVLRDGFEQVKRHAEDNNPAADVIGLRRELKGMIADFKAIASEVNDMGQEVAGLVGLGLDTVEGMIEEDKSKSKVKREVLDIIKDVRVVLPTVVTVAVATWLGYNFVGSESGTGVKAWCKSNIVNPVAGAMAIAMLKGKFNSVLGVFGFGSKEASDTE